MAIDGTIKDLQVMWVLWEYEYQSCGNTRKTRYLHWEISSRYDSVCSQL